MKNKKPSFIVRFAYLIGRCVFFNTGKSKDMEDWEFYPKNLSEWHVTVCRLCDREVMKLPTKAGWAAKSGVKANFVLCPWCFDEYELNVKPKTVLQHPTVAH